MAVVRRIALPRTFASLRNYNYRVFWLTQLLSQIGSWMQRIGQTWLVLEMTHSAAALGIISALQFLPTLLLTLHAGILGDRFPRRRIMLCTQSVALVQCAILAWLTLSGNVQLWQVYLLSAVLGLATALESPARHAFLMEMVGHDNIVNAVGLSSAQFNAARLLGPAVAGLVVAAWGAGACFAINSASFLIALTGLLLLRTELLHAVPPHLNEGGRWHQLREGLALVFSHRNLALATTLLGFITCFGYNFSILVPLLADEFNAGANGFGIMMAVMGLGSVVASFAIATIGRSRVRLVFLTAGAFALLQIAVAISPWFVLAVVLLTLSGAASMFATASTNSRLQLSAPDDKRSRVMGVYTLFYFGTSPFGSLITGYAAAAIGVRWTMGLEAGLVLAAALTALLLSRRTAPLAALPQPA